MAIRYWDPWATSTNSSTTAPYSDGTWSTWTNSSTSATGGGWYYTTTVIVTRKVLVIEPEHWTDEIADRFLRLVNIETNTGWKVELRIKGDVLITDPSIEKRSLEEFVPLIKSKASGADLEKFNAFFAEHLHPKAEAQS